MKRKREWEPLQRATHLRVPKEIAAQAMEVAGEIWINRHYQVSVQSTGTSGAQVLSIKPRDGSARHDWREFQWIKNQLCGEEREAIELYPAESRMVDVSNQFWLLVLAPGKRFPFGFEGRAVSEVRPYETSTQRPWPRELRPADLINAEEARQRIEEMVGARRQAAPVPVDMMIEPAQDPDWKAAPEVMARKVRENAILQERTGLPPAPADSPFAIPTSPIQRATRAPWTPEQVANLQRRQEAEWLHPYMCGGCSPSQPLTPTPDGWRCGCGHTQDWAHPGDAAGDFPPDPFPGWRQRAEGTASDSDQPNREETPG